MASEMKLCEICLGVFIVYLHILFALSIHNTMVTIFYHII